MSATTIDVRDADGAAVLAIHGEITGSSEDVLMEAYARASERSPAIVLDFSNLEYMNSGGIGLLVTLLIRTQRSGRRLLATGLSEHYRQILALTRLDEAIGIHDSEASALAAVRA